MEDFPVTPSQEHDEAQDAGVEHVSEVAAELADSVINEDDQTQAIEEANKQLRPAGLELVKQPATREERREALLDNLELRRLRAGIRAARLRRRITKL